MDHFHQQLSDKKVFVLLLKCGQHYLPHQLIPYFINYPLQYNSWDKLSVLVAFNFSLFMLLKTLSTRLGLTFPWKVFSCQGH